MRRQMVTTMYNNDNNLQRPYFVTHCSSHIEILSIIKFIALNMSIPRLMKELMMLGIVREPGSKI